MPPCDNDVAVYTHVSRSNQFINESKWMFVPNLKSYCQAIKEMSGWQEWYGPQMDRQPENIMPFGYGYRHSNMETH